MVQYIENILYPYVESTRQQLGCDCPALVIIDNFKGQVTTTVNELLDSHNIHTCLLPPNTTDHLQQLDIAVNKPAKDFLRQKFDEWYTQQVMQQLDGRSEDEIEQCNLEPIGLSMACVMEVGAHWLVQMAAYVADNPQFLVNGFIKAGITGALDGCLEDDNSMEDSSEVPSEHRLITDEDNDGDCLDDDLY